MSNQFRKLRKEAENISQLICDNSVWNTYVLKYCRNDSGCRIAVFSC